MSESPLSALIVSSRFPDELRPGLGNFVERQMIELARRPRISLRVVAPVPAVPWPLAWLDRRRDVRALPLRETRGGLDVHRPRCRVAPRRAMTPRALERALLPLVRRLDREAPIDLLSAEFAWPEGPAVAAIGRALGLPVSIKARGIDFYGVAGHPARRALLLDAARSAAGLLAVSAEVKAAMEAAGLPGDRIEVHHPAVDTGRFAIADRAAAKAALRLSGPVLLTVGNVAANKRQVLAVEALAYLPGATLLIVGSGPEERAIRRRISALGLAERARMIGPLPNALLPAFYNAADATIHCAAIEGFANVRLESLACGTPLVTTEAGAARDIVTSAAAGVVVPADPRAIAEAARVLIAAPPDRAATRASSLNYGWARATDQLEAWFRRIASKRV